MLLKMKVPQSSARLQEISTHSRLPAANLSHSNVASDPAMVKSARNVQMLNGPFSSAQSMNIAEGGVGSVQNSNPALQAQLTNMQDKIDRRQDELD